MRTDAPAKDKGLVELDLSRAPEDFAIRIFATPGRGESLLPSQQTRRVFGKVG